MRARIFDPGATIISANASQTLQRSNTRHLALGVGFSKFGEYREPGSALLRASPWQPSPSTIILFSEPVVFNWLACQAVLSRRSFSRGGSPPSLFELRRGTHRIAMRGAREGTRTLTLIFRPGENRLHRRKNVRNIKKQWLSLPLGLPLILTKKRGDLWPRCEKRIVLLFGSPASRCQTDAGHKGARRRTTRNSR